jgi:hypothetical protein
MPPTDGATPTFPEQPAPHTCCCCDDTKRRNVLPGDRGYLVLPLPHVRDILTFAVAVCALAIAVPVARECLGPIFNTLVAQITKRVAAQ